MRTASGIWPRQRIAACNSESTSAREHPRSCTETDDMWQLERGRPPLAKKSGKCRAGFAVIGETGMDTLTVISAYGCRGNCASRVCSSSTALIGTASWEPTRRDSCWLLAGTPVIGSSRLFRWAMLHDGDMRRSDEELGELMRSGTSAALWSDILDRGRRTGTN
jgi:hypothetical protein